MNETENQPKTASLLNATAVNLVVLVMAGLAFEGHQWAHTIVYAFVVLCGLLTPLAVVGRIALEKDGELTSKHWKRPTWYKVIAITSDFAVVGYCAVSGSVLLTIFALASTGGSLLAWRKPK